MAGGLETAARWTMKGFTAPITLPAKGAAALFRVTPKSVKNFAGITALVAGGIGLAGYFAVNPTGKQFDKNEDQLIAQIPELRMPESLMVQPAMMAQENGPAEGHGEFEWRNRARPDLAQQQQLAAVNPRMNAISPDNVTELGGDGIKLG